MQKSLKNIFYLWKVISKKNKKNIIWIIFSMLFIGLGEILTLFCVKPLILILAKDEDFNNFFLFRILDQLNIEFKLIFLGCTIILLIISINSLKIINFWQINKVSASIGTDIGGEIFSKKSLSKYYDYEKSDSSFLISALTNQMVSTVTSISNFLRSLNSIIVGFLIIFGLLILDFKKNTLAIVIFISIYLITYLVIKEKLKNLSEIIKIKSQFQIKIIKDVLGSNKEIISNNLQKRFNQIYKKIDRDLRISKAKTGTFKVIPRLIIEASAVSFLVLISIFNNLDKENNYSIISYIGSLAFGIQRLMPSMQTIYSSWSYILGETASVSNIVNLIRTETNLPIEINSENNNITFNSLEIKDLSFFYKDNKNNNKNIIFRDFNLSINQGDRIGIIGKTGSGKSTLIDIMTGIIKPKKGTIKINKKNIHLSKNKNLLYKWRDYFSYLPQKPYLIDGTIIENIAFGQDIQDVDFERIKESSKKAKIYSFIDKLPKKFHTNIGEMGSNLSGGQAQRIALARSFYSNKKLLIMDEVTSALDERTEKEIISSLNNLQPEITLIIITHKKSLLEICDKVLNLDIKT